MRVLLVDDNQDFLRVTESFLRGVPGIELVGTATSGVQAIEQAAALHPDLVLIDIRMQGMTGFEATRRIKQHHNAPKVIIMTLHADQTYRVMAANAGADGFLLKHELVAGLAPLLSSLFPGGTSPLGRAARRRPIR